MRSTSDITIERPRSSCTALELELRRLEIDIYVSLATVERSALRMAGAARREDRLTLAARAELLRSDALSRGGALDEALALQQAIAADARERGDAMIEARAGCMLASTYYRLGLLAQSQDAAQDGIRLLDARAPAHWHVEHYMVLALFTSYDRAGTVDFGLFEESLRRARTLGHPTLLLAVLNNYAWTAAQGPSALCRAVQLVDEMEALLDAGEATASAPILDTIAWVRLAEGHVERAECLLQQALHDVHRVEPDDHAAILAHLATVRRGQGRLDDAARLLERARAIALARKTPEVAVNALRELASIDADRGDHRRAYRRLARFVDEQRTAERIESERRATILQSIHGTQLERDQRRHFEQLAIRDDLTGLFNRRHLERRLPQLLADGGVAVAMIDIDHFKRINDQHSHEVGDAVLRQLAHLLHEHARTMAPDGFAVRLGGEEFLLAATVRDHDAALESLEILRRRVEMHGWGDLPVGVRPTISGGLVGCTAAGAVASIVLGRADELLYQAKRSGRNRVEAG
ncbi:MAG TPA: diguanylate cyclase [Baekduia sp.]|nr:diguanylate cyclase [Baekduia sp.]